MRLAIADPPYPPYFAERFDTAAGGARLAGGAHDSTSIGFPGAKPAAWTRWVLDALGYDPETDELVDLFPGSGSITAAATQGVLL